MLIFFQRRKRHLYLVEAGVGERDLVKNATHSDLNQDFELFVYTLNVESLVLTFTPLLLPVQSTTCCIQLLCASYMCCNYV